MPGTLINNPIAWAHFKVRGGWKNHLWSTALYTFCILAGILLTTRLNPLSNMLLAWTSGLLGLQMAILLLYGCNVIGNSIRRDATTGLLESHRLMPIASSTAVMGYLMGPPFQAITLAVANFIIGTTLAGMTGVMEQWLMANVIVLLFVAFLWVGVAFTSFVAKGAFGIIFGLMVSAFFANTGAIGLFDVIPALRVLVTPMLGNSVFTMLSRGQPVSLGYAWGILAQIVFGAIFFRGAMRRYRRDDVPALSVLLGLLLLAAWVGSCAVGIVRWSDFHPRGLRFGGRGRFAMESQAFDTSTIATVLTAMLIGVTPIAASARAATDWMRTFIGSGRAPGRRPLPPPLIACIAAAIALPIVAASPPEAMSKVEAFTRVGIVLLSYFLSISYLLRIFYRAGRKAFALIAIWLVLTWLFPMGLEAIRRSALVNDSQAMISLGSPWGTLLDIWSANPSSSFGSLAFQGLLAAGLAALFYTSEPKLRPQPSLEPIQ